MRFSTLKEIYKALDCQPEDILSYNEEERRELFPFLINPNHLAVELVVVYFSY